MGGGGGRKNGRTGRNPSVSKNPELYPERSALREIGAKNLNSHFLMNREPLIPDQRVPDKFPGWELGSRNLDSEKGSEGKSAAGFRSSRSRYWSSEQTRWKPIQEIFKIVSDSEKFSNFKIIYLTCALLYLDPIKCKKERFFSTFIAEHRCVKNVKNAGKRYGGGGGMIKMKINQFARFPIPSHSDKGEFQYIIKHSRPCDFARYYGGELTSSAHLKFKRAYKHT